MRPPQALRFPKLDGPIVGDVSRCSEETQAWLDEQPTSGGPAQVLAAAARRGREDALEEKAARLKREAYEAKQEELADVYAFRGGEIPTIADRFRQWRAQTEIEDAHEGEVGGEGCGDAG